MNEYIGLLTQQQDIESHMLKGLNDHLNAEIALGTVTNVIEAIQWLGYTFLYVRMMKNPLLYGSTWEEMRKDSDLYKLRRNMINLSLRELDEARLIKYDERSENISSTDSGRLSSHYYIKFNTAKNIQETMTQDFEFEDIFALLSKSDEFSQMKVRNEEVIELEKLNSAIKYEIISSSENAIYSKVNVLIQCYIDRKYPKESSLASDINFISQSAPRIARYLFEISLKNGWASLSQKLLDISKMIEKKLWTNYTALWQFQDEFPDGIILATIDKNKLSIKDIKQKTAEQLSTIFRDKIRADNVKRLANSIPLVKAVIKVQPVTRSVLRLQVRVKPTFTWIPKYHGISSQSFWLTVEDIENDYIYYSENLNISKTSVEKEEYIEVIFTIPLFNDGPDNYILRIVSDTWIGSEYTTKVSLKDLILPGMNTPFTDLLNLNPLPIKAFKNAQYEQLYNYSHFNPIQTQVFHTLYHTDNNVLLGAPTGSGKTSVAEMAIFRVFNIQPNKKVVYIAPLKALVRERVDDWQIKFGRKLNKKVIELTGDCTPDMRSIAEANVIITTPEKWDAVIRSWQQRKFVQDVVLIVIDEIHLLGEDRGPVLEVIVSRTNFITATTQNKVRIVGLSTALANAEDLGSWLNIDADSIGLYNFRPSVRPVPLQIHIQGFPGRAYCPRMTLMNKPIYQAIQIHSPKKPVLIFTSNRRQTRLTAIDLISFMATDMSPTKWSSMTEHEIKLVTENVTDPNLKMAINYGIGIHHAGLQEGDRKVVEHLFLNQKIQVLIATSTLAWGVNFPAHLVIVKGTEYFDGITKRYINYPITDVLQMTGRAGRPQFDDNAKAVVMVQDTKKEFYKNFLYEPFPVESSLLKALHEHINAEIVSGTITNINSAINYLSWTFLFRRILKNPNYYGLKDSKPDSINKYLSMLMDLILDDLKLSNCIEVIDNNQLEPLPLGKITSYYYLKHQTIRLFNDKLKDKSSLQDLLTIFSSAEEFSQVPVRHTEDQLNFNFQKW